MLWFSVPRRTPDHAVIEQQPTAHQRHIDGLRGIAVLAVIVFHIRPELLPGGFAGVDLFFVISGYLITGILLDDIANHRFTLGAFYARRAKRILPAAFACIAITLAAGLLLLSPPAFSDLARSAAFATAFAGNYWFASRTDYFDTPTEIEPLVHLWSLGVEEQFYIAFPLALHIAYRRRGRAGAAMLIVVVTALSFALCALVTPFEPKTSFYLLPTRAWQFLVGGALHFVRIDFQRNAGVALLLALGGCVALLANMFVLSPETGYPGTAALSPTLGAAAVLLCAPHAALVRNALSISPLRWLGRISYSAYLWHWPIIVYWRIYSMGRPFTIGESVLLAVLSVVCGYLSWRYLEERYRRHPAAPVRVGLVTATAAGCLAIACAATIASGGAAARFDAKALPLADHEQMWEWTCNARDPTAPFDCVVGARWSSARVRGVVWGDSHAEHWAPVLDGAARREGIALRIVNTQCAPYVDRLDASVVVPRQPEHKSMCEARHKLLRAWLAQNPDVSIVIFAAAWSMRQRHIDVGAGVPADQIDAQRSELVAVALVRTISTLAAPGREVLLLGDVPRSSWPLNDCILARHSVLLRESCAIDARGLAAAGIRTWHDASERALRAAAVARADAEFLSAVDALCDATHCPLEVGGEWIYMDGNHLRRNLAANTLTALAHTVGMDSYLRDRAQTTSTQFATP